MSRFPSGMSLFPLVLSLSKDAYRRETHFYKLSANGFSFRYLSGATQ
ncbi:hypothetical protein [Parasphingorhabdus sp.]